MNWLTECLVCGCKYGYYIHSTINLICTGELFFLITNIACLRKPVPVWHLFLKTFQNFSLIRLRYNRIMRQLLLPTSFALSLTLARTFSLIPDCNHIFSGDRSVIKYIFQRTLCHLHRDLQSAPRHQSPPWSSRLLRNVSSSISFKIKTDFLFFPPKYLLDDIECVNRIDPRNERNWTCKC